MTKEIQLRNQVDDLEKVAQFVDEVSNELLLSPELSMNFNLVLEEMVSNVIFYAYPKEQDAPITLAAKAHAGSISFVITDKGRPFDPTARQKADMSVNPADRQLGGMGIFITRQIMDEVSYQRVNDCNVLTMTKKLDT